MHSVKDDICDALNPYDMPIETWQVVIDGIVSPTARGLEPVGYRFWENLFAEHGIAVTYNRNPRLHFKSISNLTQPIDLPMRRGWKLWPTWPKTFAGKSKEKLLGKLLYKLPVVRLITFEVPSGGLTVRVRLCGRLLGHI
jgi:hypothetical protein